MKFEISNGFIKGLPLAIAITFLVQGSAIVWWASAKVKDSDFVAQRVERLEVGFEANYKVQNRIQERLARIEERMASFTVLLNRIDQHVK